MPRDSWTIDRGSAIDGIGKVVARFVIKVRRYGDKRGCPLMAKGVDRIVVSYLVILKNLAPFYLVELVNKLIWCLIM